MPLSCACLGRRLPVGLVLILRVGGDVVAICAVGVHRRQADAGLVAEVVLRHEQDLRSVCGPYGVGRSANAELVVGEVGELLAVDVDSKNVAIGRSLGKGLEGDLGAVW